MSSWPGKPAIETPDIAEVTKEGDEVTLRCSAHGFPTPQFTWTPSGKEVTVRKKKDRNKTYPIFTLCGFVLYCFIKESENAGVRELQKK